MQPAGSKSGQDLRNSDTVPGCCTEKQSLHRQDDHVVTALQSLVGLPVLCSGRAREIEHKLGLLWQWCSEHGFEQCRFRGRCGDSQAACLWEIMQTAGSKSGHEI